MPNPRKLLYPFSVLYHVVTGVRNKLYDTGILHSESYDLPVICVGNLNVGGTGKSPMIEYLIRLLKDDHKLATLSRGYKRETKGFQIVEKGESASRVGDEPLQFKSKFEDIIVAVDANRREGIAELLNYSPEVILLDDAYQHRRVKPGFNILLTAYNDLFTDDLLLPGGNLRESRSGAKRADFIVVTKCPVGLSREQMESISKKLGPDTSQEVFFTTIDYADEVTSTSSKIALTQIPQDYSLLTGIANPEPLLEYLREKDIRINHLEYPDHHNFSQKELEKIKKEKGIITTEKDFMRLRGKLKDTPLYYLPIQVKFLEGEDIFRKRIQSFMNEK